MTDPTPWPGRPGEPVEPERDGEHVMAVTDQHGRVWHEVWRWQVDGASWLRPNFSGPVYGYEPRDLATPLYANIRYVGPFTTPDQIKERDAYINDGFEAYLASALRIEREAIAAERAASAAAERERDEARRQWKNYEAVAVDRHAERDALLALLRRAEEELRLINLKDTGAIYDVGLRTAMRLALAHSDASALAAMIEAARREGMLEAAHLCRSKAMSNASIGAMSDATEAEELAEEIEAVVAIRARAGAGEGGAS
jgi:hypothetical protein